jgi:hypothetical protein
VPLPPAEEEPDNQFEIPVLSLAGDVSAHASQSSRLGTTLAGGGREALNLSPARFREMLLQSLDDPATARSVARRLALPAFPIEGAALMNVMTNGGTVGYLPVFQTSSTEIENSILFEDAANTRIGIGTASPAVPLHVAGSATVGIKYVSSAHAYMQVDGATASQAGYYIFKAGSQQWAMFVAASSNDLAFYDNSGTRVTFQRGGNVGIGTTSPAAKLHVAGTYGDNGEAVSGLDRTFRGSFQPAQLDALRTRGLDYHMDTPIRDPGGYQMRVAVRDPVSHKAGSASQFIEIPDVRRERLALSGIVLSPEIQGEKGPAVRHFQAGDRVRYQLDIYNARRDKSTQSPNLESKIQIFRDNRLVSTENPGAISQVPWDSQRQVMSGELTLGPNIAPGHYALQVTVTDKLAPEKHSMASQWIDFEVAPADGTSPR